MSSRSARLSTEDIVRPRGRVGVTLVEDEVVLLDHGDGTLYHLNRTAAAVWLCLDGTRPLAEVIDDLLVEAEADARTVRREVLALVDELDDLGLLEVTTTT